MEIIMLKHITISVLVLILLSFQSLLAAHEDPSYKAMQAKNTTTVTNCRGLETNGKKLLIIVPVLETFQNLVLPIVDPTTNLTTVSGSCWDPFNAAFNALDYQIALKEGSIVLQGLSPEGVIFDNLNFVGDRVQKLYAPEDYAKALTSGSVDAIVDETLYQKTVLAMYPTAGFSLIATTSTTNGVSERFFVSQRDVD